MIIAVGGTQKPPLPRLRPSVVAEMNDTRFVCLKTCSHAVQEVEFHFGPGRMLPGKCSLGRATSLLLIKPHLVADGAAGLVIDLLMVRCRLAQAVVMSGYM